MNDILVLSDLGSYPISLETNNVSDFKLLERIFFYGKERSAHLTGEHGEGTGVCDAYPRELDTLSRFWFCH